MVTHKQAGDKLIDQLKHHRAIIYKLTKIKIKIKIKEKDRDRDKAKNLIQIKGINQSNVRHASMLKKNQYKGHQKKKLKMNSPQLLKNKM